jgi:predicted secreted protein
MKQIQQLVFAILILVALSSAAFAGDYAHFHFIGFSQSGKYLAFEEYGTNDDVDDSSPYSIIYIVDVDANKFATAPLQANLNIYTDEDSDKQENEVRARTKRRAQKQLKRFGIIDGNTGLQVAAHLLNEYETDYEEPVSPTKEAEPVPTPETNANVYSPNENSNSSVDQNKAESDTNSNTSPLNEEKVDPMADYEVYLPQQVSFTKAGNALYRVGLYQIKIKPVPVTQKNCDQYERDMFSFEMTLKNERGDIKILQESGKVPKNRGCVDSYGIQEAFLYNNKLAVFVGIFTRGWEGENMRLMAVTGELDD